MNFRIPFSWFDIRNSLWYRPAVMTAAAVILSFVTIGLDNTLFGDGRSDVWWLFEGGAEGARGVLSAISSTMITVATTAFSFTLVAMQLSSSQYSPRIVRNFTGDPVNQFVIGAFVGTFAYSLLILRVVRSEAADQEAFVPAISVTVALLLSAVCIASLIYFFHHATRTIQSSVVITQTTDLTKRVIEAVASRHEGTEWRLTTSPVSRPSDLTMVGSTHMERAGYVQDIDHGRMKDLAVEYDLFLEIHPHPGDFILPNDTVITIWAYPESDILAHDAGGGRNGDEDAPRMSEENGDLVDSFRETIQLGLERTLEWDAEFGLQQTVDIAVRALSPGINDPTTANVTIDRIGELLILLHPISGQEWALLDDVDVLRLCQPAVRWDEYVKTSLLPVRHFGSSDPVVATHVLHTIARLLPGIPAYSHAPLMTAAEDMAEQALEQIVIETDREMILGARDRVLQRAH